MNDDMTWWQEGEKHEGELVIAEIAIDPTTNRPVLLVRFEKIGTLGFVEPGSARMLGETLVHMADHLEQAIASLN